MVHTRAFAYNSDVFLSFFKGECKLRVLHRSAERHALGSILRCLETVSRVGRPRNPHNLSPLPRAFFSLVKLDSTLTITCVMVRVESRCDFVVSQSHKNFRMA